MVFSYRRFRKISLSHLQGLPLKMGRYREKALTILDFSPSNWFTALRNLKSCATQGQFCVCTRYYVPETEHPLLLLNRRLFINCSYRKAYLVI